MYNFIFTAAIEMYSDFFFTAAIETYNDRNRYVMCLDAIWTQPFFLPLVICGFLRTQPKSSSNYQLWQGIQVVC